MKKNNKTLLALSSVALGLHGISTKAATPTAEAEGNVQYGYYIEEGDRMQAQVYHGDFVVPINDFFEFTFSYDWDVYIGATPSHSTPQVMADVITAASGSRATPFKIAENIFQQPDARNARLSATGTQTEKGIIGLNAVIKRPIPDFKPVESFQFQPRENRKMPILGTNLYLGDVTMGLNVGQSIEPDFESTFGSINLSWELNNKLTTLSAGYTLTHNDITRSSGDSGGGGHHGGSDDDDDDKDTEEFRRESTFHGINLGLSQVMSKHTLFHLNGSYTNQAGYLSNPYKYVYVRGEITGQEYLDVLRAGPDSQIGFSNATDLETVGPDLFREVRPDKRHQWTISTGINQHIPALDASLHFDYRYYKDSWDISSHTFDLSWHQELPFGLTVVPNIRYYSQSAADFFAPYFLTPRADGYYSSDYRLSGFGKLGGGVSIHKQFAKGIRLNAGFEYFSHQGSLKLGGGGVDDYADIDSFLVSGSLEVDLSSLSGTGSEHNHHNMRHHGGHPPAGVMFGHMLDQAGDMMVGYHYMYGNSSGSMRLGTNSVDDQQLISRACVDLDCTFKPGEMTMHMHMFNLMYAPTDWLNLMVMPQLISMDMDMLPLDSEDEAGGHESAGLGDTLLVALIKLFDTETHHIHLGLGFSAPTGSIEATFDNTESEESDLQSFGMQLGSGTWDFKPSLTYTGNTGRWFWGAQASATKRMQSRNKLGYVLGDEIQGSIWGGYRVLDWLSFSVRNVYKAQGSIRGQINRVIPPADPPVDPEPTPLENPANYGGQFWDIGLGVNLSAPNSEFAGHSLSIEWLQPVIHDFNGYQLERNGSLSVRWGYAF